MRSTVS